MLRQPPGFADVEADEGASVGRGGCLGVDFCAEIQTLGDVAGDRQTAGPEVPLPWPWIDLVAAAAEHLPLAEVFLGPDRQQQVGPGRTELAAGSRNEGAREHRQVDAEAVL